MCKSAVPSAPLDRLTFVVRVTRDHRGRVSGIVERVRTGEKEPFDGAETIGPLIARMLERRTE
jgi:hypothetical protein